MLDSWVLIVSSGRKRTVCDEAAEVAANDAVPGCAFALVELLNQSDNDHSVC